MRSWREDDLATLHALNQDERVYRYLAGYAYSEAESREQFERFRRHWDEHGFGIWAVEEAATGRLVGRCGPAFHRLWPEHPELGWKLDPEVWGRGYATEAGEACLRWGFEELGFDRVVSIVIRENERSIRVQERLGFVPWSEVLWPETGSMLQVRSTTRAAWETVTPGRRPGLH